MIKSMFVGLITLRIEHEETIYMRDSLVFRILRMPLFVWLKKEEFRLYLLSRGVAVNVADIKGGTIAKNAYREWRPPQYVVQHKSEMCPSDYKKLFGEDND
tara:strand:- start:112 stop:414 length:303 start_codon:yes stop_codon:yes gene_type:complete